MVVAFQPWKRAMHRDRSSDFPIEPGDEKPRSIFRSPVKRGHITKDMISLVRTPERKVPPPSFRSYLDTSSPDRAGLDGDVFYGGDEPDMSLAELDRLFNGLSSFAMANPGKPLPPQYHSGLLQILEAHRKIRSQLERVSAQLGAERESRQSLEAERDRQQIYWRLEKADYEYEIKKLEALVQEREHCDVCLAATAAAAAAAASELQGNPSTDGSDEMAKGGQEDRPTDKKRKKGGHKRRGSSSHSDCSTDQSSTPPKDASDVSPAVTWMRDHLPRVKAPFKLVRKVKTEVQLSGLEPQHEPSMSPEAEPRLSTNDGGENRGPKGVKTGTDQHPELGEDGSSDQSDHSASPTKPSVRAVRRVRFDLGDTESKPAAEGLGESVMPASATTTDDVANKLSGQSSATPRHRSSMGKAGYDGWSQETLVSLANNKAGHRRNFSFTPGDDRDAFMSTPIQHAAAVSKNSIGAPMYGDDRPDAQSGNTGHPQQTLADKVNLGLTNAESAALDVFLHQNANRAHRSNREARLTRNEDSTAPTGDTLARAVSGSYGPKKDVGQKKDAWVTDDAKARDVKFSSVAAARAVSRSSVRAVV